MKEEDPERSHMISQTHSTIKPNDIKIHDNRKKEESGKTNQHQEEDNRVIPLIGRKDRNNHNSHKQ